MKAVKLSEPRGSLEIVNVEIPEPGPGEVRVKIEASGVCHTDVHLRRGDWKEVAGLVKRPLILGHEGIGVIDSIGADVDRRTIGERVGVAFLRSSCGNCRRCKAGEENVCAAATTVGMSHDGCHAEYVVAVADYVVPVPEGLTSEQAAPLCCAGVTVLGALKRAALSPGDTVAVFGIGGLGHLAVQIAKSMGARVVALDIDEAKLELASALGADDVLKADDPDLIPRLMAMDLEAVVMTTTSHQAHAVAVATVSPGGKVLLLAVPGEPVPLSAVLAVFKGVALLGQAVGSRRDLIDTFELAASGKLRCEVHTRPLEALPEVLEDLAAARVVGRVVLTP